MKILKIFGIVVGLHAVVLIMIFANPGCSSSGGGDARPTPADTAPPSASSGPAASPMVTLPGATAAPADSEASAAAGSAAAEPGATVVFAPTRPDTPAATALETQPVGGVTPVTTYVVGKGDSLWSIAKRHHVKMSAIAHANRISAGAPLHLGQKLIIPGAPASVPLGGTPAGAAASSSYSEPVRGAATAPSGALTYRVKPGDTLGGIARKFHVSRADLGAANSIADPQTIRPGQELVIPSKHRVAHASALAAEAPSAGSGPAAEAGVAAPAPADSGQDLDAGLKPAVAGGVPTIKLDDTGTQSGQGGQQ